MSVETFPTTGLLIDLVALEPMLAVIECEPLNRLREIGCPSVLGNTDAWL